jgi:hypothetical protein
LGERYKDKPHLIWVLGGDRPAIAAGVDYRPLFRAMAKGLTDGITTQTNRSGVTTNARPLITYHPAKGGPDAQSGAWFHTDDWLSFHSIQAWPEWQLPNTQRDYQLQPPKPTWVFEGRYEGYWKNHHRPEDWGEWQVRQQAYQTVFSGAFGHTYGHERVYGFGSDGANWRDFLDAPGAKSMVHLARLMNAFSPQVRLTLSPDPDLIDGDIGQAERFKSDRITAFRSASRGAVAAFYTASGRPLRVRMDRLPEGPMNAWWFNPRTGGWVTPQGETPSLSIHTPNIPSGPGTGTREFTPPGPAGDGHDWVLILGKNPALY